MRGLGFTAATLAVAISLTLGTTTPSGAAPGDHPYVVLGDSVSYGTGAGPGTSFAQRLYGSLQASHSADVLINRAQPGVTAAGGRGTQLALALGDINAPSDTVAMTAGFGGNEALTGSCNLEWDSPSCPLRANLDYIFSELTQALIADPGAEFTGVLAYYNPKIGSAQEAAFAEIILGADGALGCLDAGDDLGLNDVIAQEAGDHLLPVANTYPAMKSAGPSAISGDQIHPNDLGHEVIAQTFRDAAPICPPTPDGLPDLDPDPPPRAKCMGATATMHAQPGRVTEGTGERDVIVGSSQRDRIRARGGNDLVCAGAGNDEIVGAAGRDVIATGNGADRISGQSGRDFLSGQGGPDRLFGGVGRDRLRGGAGNDRLLGGPARDRLLGGPGRNRLTQ